jgi:hypothetical protein
MLPTLWPSSKYASTHLRLSTKILSSTPGCCRPARPPADQVGVAGQARLDFRHGVLQAVLLQVADVPVAQQRRAGTAGVWAARSCSRMARRCVRLSTWAVSRAFCSRKPAPGSAAGVRAGSQADRLPRPGSQRGQSGGCSWDGCGGHGGRQSYPFGRIFAYIFTSTGLSFLRK